MKQKKLAKFSMIAIALLVVTSAMAQGRSGNHPNNSGQVKVGAPANTNSNHGRTEREDARVNGEINANAHASATAKRHADENSVLNRTTTVTTKTWPRHKHWQYKTRKHHHTKVVHKEGKDEDKKE